MENVKAAAKKIQKMGTGGDTILAHINPREAELLKMMGGTGAINPDTGLPEFKKFWKRITAKNIVAAAPVIIAVAAPGIGSAIGTAIAGAVGATVTAAEAAAIGSAVMGGTVAAAKGGNVEQVLKAAASAGIASAAGSVVGGEAAAAGAPQTVAGAAGGAAQGATGAALTGRDVGAGALTGGIVGGVSSGVTQALTPKPELTAAPDTTSGIDFSKPVDYSLAEGLKFPSEGFKAPALAPLPAAETIGYTPIDYNTLLAPATPSVGYKTPKLKELQPAATIGTRPINYEEIFTPEIRNLPEMGGGTGITARDASGVPIQLAPSDSGFAKEAGKAAGALTSYFLAPKPSYGGYTPSTSTSVGATESGTTPGSAALAQALRLGEPIDVATGKSARRPVWNIASLRTKDETGS